MKIPTPRECALYAFWGVMVYVVVYIGLYTISNAWAKCGQENMTMWCDLCSQISCNFEWSSITKGGESRPSLIPFNVNANMLGRWCEGKRVCIPNLYCDLYAQLTMTRTFGNNGRAETYI